jgi:hypothetical protein
VFLDFIGEENIGNLEAEQCLVDAVDIAQDHGRKALLWKAEQLRVESCRIAGVVHRAHAAISAIDDQATRGSSGCRRYEWHSAAVA